MLLQLTTVGLSNPCHVGKGFEMPKTASPRWSCASGHLPEFQSLIVEFSSKHHFPEKCRMRTLVNGLCNKYILRFGHMGVFISHESREKRCILPEINLESSMITYSWYIDSSTSGSNVQR